MKKTTLVFLISLLFLSLCFFYYPPSAAQNRSSREDSAQKASTPFFQEADNLKEVPLMIRNAASAGAHFERRELFQTVTSALENHPQLSQVLGHGTVLNLNESAVDNTLMEKVEFLTLPLPDGKGGTVELELKRVDIFADGFSVKTAVPTTEDLAEGLGLHYRGIVKGDERSLAAISVFKNEVMGFFSTEINGNSVVGRLGGNNPSNDHIAYAQKDLKISQEPFCDTKDPEVTLPASALQEPGAVAGACVRIYIESNYDLFQNKGSVANTISYLTGLFNQSATLFSNDSVPVSLSEIFVWNSPSPYTGADSLAVLNQFRTTRTSFNGDLAHLVSLQSSYGGRAYLDVICNTSFRYAFSGIHATYSNVPTYSWSVNVFTHETGHNLGSPHTHACAWNGNNTAIDACGPTAGYPYEGSCSGAPLPPSNGGTIMSYCHLNVGINFSLGFGTQPKNLILNRFNAASCLTACGGGSCAPTSIAAGQTLNGTLTTTDCRYPTGSSWYSDPYTFNGTAGQQVAITMTSSAFDTWLALQDPSGTELTFDNNGGGGTNSRIPATSGFYTLPSTGTYKIQASSNLTNATGSYTVSLTQPGPANDNFVNSQTVSGNAGTVTGTNVGATKESGEPNHAGNAGGKSVWYRWQAPNSGSATITTLGSNYDSLLGVYTGSTVSALSLVASNDDDPNGGLTSRVSFNATAGTTYRIAVDGFNAASGNISLNWSLTGQPSTWTETDIAVGADNLFRSLWNKTDGSVALWVVAPNGAYQGTPYGPYSGWTAKAIAAGYDNLTRVLWTHTNGSVSLWVVAANGSFQSNVYGPYAGWTAVDIGVGADNQRRILWTHTNGSVSVWVVAANGSFQSRVYGPYAGWTARRLAVGSDNNARVLLTHTNGSVALWTIVANGSFQGTAYGPYSGWSGADIGVGSDNKTRVLWKHTNGSITLWTVQPNGSFQPASYGPYAGWTGRSIAVGSDNQTRVLWNHTSGSAAHWVVAPNGSFQSRVYGPF